MRRTPFYRVSGCVNAAGKPTSVGLHKNTELPQLEHLAYGCRATVNSAIRAASRNLALLSNRTADGSALNSDSWSKAVVSRARSALAGSYQPAKAAALEAALIAELDSAVDAALGLVPKAEAALAAENNAAWGAQ
jgi:hypothetical protein